MKRARAREATPRKVGVDDILPEYDFSRARPNKYASRYAKGGVAITHDPDVAAVFPRGKRGERGLARTRGPHPAASAT